MAAKPTLGVPLSIADQRVVTAYLVAITPVLQDSMEIKREIAEAGERTRVALATAHEAPAGGTSIEPAREASAKSMETYDPKEAAEVFDDLCTQCHDVDDVEDDPPESREDARDVIRRMIEHGLEAEADELETVEEYLVRTYVDG